MGLFKNKIIKLWVDNLNAVLGTFLKKISNLLLKIYSFKCIGGTVSLNSLHQHDHASPDVLHQCGHVPPDVIHQHGHVPPEDPHQHVHVPPEVLHQQGGCVPLEVLHQHGHVPPEVNPDHHNSSCPSYGKSLTILQLLLVEKMVSVT